MDKVRREKIFNARPPLPVRVLWRRGRAFKPTIMSAHAELELQFVKCGRGAYCIAGQSYEFYPQSLLLIRPREAHGFTPAPGVFMEKVTLMLRLSRFADRALRLRLARVPRHLRLLAREAAQLELILRQLADEQRMRQPGWKEWCALKIRETFLLVLRAGRRGDAGAALPLAHPVVQRMLEYVDAHFQERVRMADLAACMGFSASHLAHLCKRYLGAGLRQCVLRRRVQEAQRLLRNDPGLKVKAIAERVGFGEFSAFNRIFKRHTGMTPADYRRLSPARRL